MKWKRKIYKRDNRICKICGQKREKICAHHIESYDSNEELRFVPSNGVVLCKNHHILFHKSMN